MGTHVIGFYATFCARGAAEISRWWRLCETTGSDGKRLASPERAADQGWSVALSGLATQLNSIPVVTLRSPPANIRRPFRTKTCSPICVETNDARAFAGKPQQVVASIPMNFAKLLLWQRCAPMCTIRRAPRNNSVRLNFEKEHGL